MSIKTRRRNPLLDPASYQPKLNGPLNYPRTVTKVTTTLAHPKEEKKRRRKDCWFLIDAGLSYYYTFRKSLKITWHLCFGGRGLCMLLLIMRRRRRRSNWEKCRVYIFRFVARRALYYCIGCWAVIDTFSSQLNTWKPDNNRRMCNPSWIIIQHSEGQSPPLYYGTTSSNILLLSEEKESPCSLSGRIINNSTLFCSARLAHHTWTHMRPTYVR